MQRKELFPFVTLMLIATIMITMLPASAWVYPDGSEDAKFEGFGPRADKLLIHLYADDTAEFTALKGGDIDITDWPLSKTEYDIMTAPPYNATLNVVNYGAEYGLFIIDLNANDNQYLGNPQDATYPNPVADRDDGAGNAKIKAGDGSANNRNPMSDVNMRRAIAHLIDRPGLISHPTIGAGFGFPLYTTMPPPNAKYLLSVFGDIDMRWAWEFNITAAEEQLELGLFKVNIGTGYRYWDRNDDNVEQADEYVELIFYIRSDHPGRNNIGTVVVAQMATINLRVNAQYATSGIAFVNVMVNKDFHMYTGGWGLGVDPDHLILWSWDWYWHPGFSYNYGGHNDPQFNAAADGIMFANTQDEAVQQALLAQYRQALMVLGIPIYAVSGNKAYSKTYVGDTAAEVAAGYTGQNWQGVVNVMGYGIDQGSGFENMHPEGYERGSGDMTIRWGYKVPDMKQLNPIYSSWLYDWNVLDRLYGSLLARNDSDLGQFLPALAESFEVGTYAHPVYGNSSKIKFTLRPDATWQDGTPVTVADVYFTFVELKAILSSRGFPNPWWFSNVMNILSFSITDPYNFEVLLDVKSYWAVGWIGGNIVLPKHIWKPIAESGDPQLDQPDPNLIGSGPWRFAEYVENSHVLLYANKPGSVVLGVTSPNGVYIYNPVNIEIRPPASRNKLNPGELHDVEVIVTNLLDATQLKVNKYVYIDDVLNATIDPLFIDAGNEHVEVFVINGGKGLHKIKVAIHIKLPNWLTSTWINATAYIWKTITEDISGSTFYDDIGEGGYPFKSQLRSPDLKVDIKDIAIAAKAFGSYPGHARWSTIADIVQDFKIDIRDIASIAKKFGWA